MADFTLAVIGHNEADRLHYALAQARAAAQPGDRVWFVDSASDDGSAERAAALGAEIVPAPIGKGRAIAAAFEQCRTDFIVFVDGDMEASECNVFAALRDAVIATNADMVIADIREPLRPFRLITPNVYVPLMQALFPEALAPDMNTPLSGLRALRTGFPAGDFPPEYGVETHLNVRCALHGTVAVRPVGDFFGPVRPNSVAVARDVTRAILDNAENEGRLAPARRPEWEAWVQCVLEVMSEPAGASGGPLYFERLHAASARPMPGVAAVR